MSDSDVFRRRTRPRWIGVALALSLTSMSASLGASSPLADGQPLDLGAMTATREHPLFSPSRHRPAPPPVRVVAPIAPVAVPVTRAMPPPTAILTGIIIGPAASLAVLKLATSQKSVSLKLGASLDGWTVIDIRPQFIVIGHGDERLTLRLRPDRKPQGSGPQPDRPAAM